MHIIYWKQKKEHENFKKYTIYRYNSRCIYQSELDTACVQHDMAYGGFNNLPRRPSYVKLLRDKAFDIAKNPKCDGYQRGLTSMVYEFFHKKFVNINRRATINNCVSYKKHLSDLTEKLHMPITRTIEKRKVYWSFRDLGCWSSSMQLMSKLNEGIRFSLCIIDNYRYLLGLFPFSMNQAANYIKHG